MWRWAYPHRLHTQIRADEPDAKHSVRLLPEQRRQRRFNDGRVSAQQSASDILEAAGTTIPEGTGGPVSVQLPFNSDTNRTVIVQARNFNASVPIRVSLIPESGDPITYDAQIDNAAANPAQTTVNVGFPLNTRVNVQVWTR